MQLMTWKECLVGAGKSEAWFQSARRRGEMALAWGLKGPIPHGKYCELDSVALALTAELGAGLGLKEAAKVLDWAGDAWLAAVAKAEHTRGKDVMLIYAENGGGKPPVLWNMTIDEFTEVMKGASGQDIQMPTRMLWINVNALLEKIRANGRAVGLDLSGAFIWPLDDPRVENLRNRVKAKRKEWFDLMAAEADQAAGVVLAQ